MGFLYELLLIFSSIGVINSLFVALFLLLSSKNKEKPALKILAVLLIMFVIRIGKSVVLYFYPALDSLYINIGLAAFASVGPLIYLFTVSSLNEKFRFSTVSFLHFLPFLLILVCAGMIGYRRNPLWIWIYRAVLAQIFIYLAASYRKLIKTHADNGQHGANAFIRLTDFLLAFTVIWLSYFLHAGIKGYPYVLSPLVYTCLFYFMAFKFLKESDFQGLGIKTAKYKNINLDAGIQQKHTEVLLRIMQDESVCKNSRLTLSQIAKMMQVSPQILSFIINSSFHQNFSEFVNSYRIKAAKKMLEDPKYQHQTIASIAFECGFNSLSVFNTAFRKTTGLTPSDYRSKSLIM